ncbi:MAG: hypothetical protein LBR56_09190 [Sporomusaceae bacterium]|nr:hypothetical protein [Sporomusaceae bacterium]
MAGFKIRFIIAPVLLLMLAFFAFSASPEEEVSEAQTAAVTAPDPKIALTDLNDKPLMPRRFSPQTNWRDPFAAPQATQPETARETSAKPPGDLPFLAGIISSGSRKLAIIVHNGTSRPYKEGELAGKYKVLKIEENTVILETGAAAFTIRLP